MPAFDRLKLGLAAWVPRWWAGQGGAAGAFLDLALWPGEAVYRGVVDARNRLYDRGWLRVDVAAIPVISVGNLGVGGTGKTPVAAWIAGRLAELGARPAVVLRGYGRDEVLVHRELNPHVPVFADPVRVRAVAAAAGSGCTVAVLDDAFQHRKLSRTFDVVLLSAESWNAEPRLLPRGPWREAPAALRRADMVVVTRKSATDENADAVRRSVEVLAPGVYTVICRLQPAVLTPLHGGARSSIETLAGMRVLAVAALAAPAPFVENLEASGADVELAAFPDHHEFTEAEVAGLRKRASGRPIVMTLKDAVKLRAMLDGSASALVLRQQVRIEDGGDRLDAILREIAEGSRR